MSAEGQSEAELVARITRGVLASDRRAEEVPRDRVILYEGEGEDAEVAAVIENIGGGRRRIRSIERDEQKRIVAVHERIEHGPDLERAAELRAFAELDAASAKSRPDSYRPPEPRGSTRPSNRIGWPG
jgi:hypothetical protein